MKIAKFKEAVKKEKDRLIHLDLNDQSEYFDGKVDGFELGAAFASRLTRRSDRQSIRDLVNWVKKEISESKHSKMSKYLSPYREEKIEFLSKILRKLESNLAE